MSLKGPAVAESDNLNPWQFKRERAPRSRNTAPSVSQTSVTFERLEALHNCYEGLPATQGQMAEQREIGSLETQAAAQKPTLQETVNLQECALVQANAAPDLGPQVVSRETLAIETAPTLTNETTLNPTSSKDLLEGYKEKFFLKQDGYDD